MTILLTTVVEKTVLFIVYIVLNVKREVKWIFAYLISENQT
jgi:hypothetical protein